MKYKHGLIPIKKWGCLIFTGLAVLSCSDQNSKCADSKMTEQMNTSMTGNDTKNNSGLTFRLVLDSPTIKPGNTAKVILKCNPPDSVLVPPLLEIDYFKGMEYYCEIRNENGSEFVPSNEASVSDKDRVIITPKENVLLKGDKSLESSFDFLFYYDIPAGKYSIRAVYNPNIEGTNLKLDLPVYSDWMDVEIIR